MDGGKGVPSPAASRHPLPKGEEFMPQKPSRYPTTAQRSYTAQCDHGLVIKVPCMGEDHGQAKFIGPGDHVGVLLAAAGLDDG